MLILLSKLTRVGGNSTEVKIIQRGQYYLTPFQPYHIDEVVEHLSSENIEELALLGYTNIREAITDMYETSECYIARKEGETFLAVGGLWYNEDQDCPQMFAMFSDNTNVIGPIGDNQFAVKPVDDLILLLSSKELS